MLKLREGIDTEKLYRASLKVANFKNQPFSQQNKIRATKVAQSNKSSHREIFLKYKQTTPERRKTRSIISSKLKKENEEGKVNQETLIIVPPQNRPLHFLSKTFYCTV